MIRYLRGNLLKAPTQALVNTVNTVGVMGKGLAAAFKQAYPRNYVAYREACEAGQVEIGRMFLFETGQDYPRYLINFPTKQHWRQPSQLAYIEAGLKDLVQLIEAKDMESIAVPPLGCGNGKLTWEAVQPLLERYLAPLSDTREVLVFEPGYQPAVAQTQLGPTPRLTPARAMLLHLFVRYQRLGYSLNLLVAQKLAYFLQKVGEPLRLNFDKGWYGPYAHELNFVLQRLNGHYLRYAEQRNRPDTELELLPHTQAEVAAYLAQALNDAQRQRLSTVEALIEGFETPFSLELLGTVDLIRTHCPDCDVEQIIDQIHRWTRRKQELMKPAYVRVAYGHLVAQLSGA